MATQQSTPPGSDSVPDAAPSASEHPPGSLAGGQLIILITLGVVFWFLVALFVRYGVPAGLYGGTASLISFVVIFPVGWLVIHWIKKLAGLSIGQVMPGIAVATAAASFCDGIALTWGRALYGSDPDQIVLGAGAILWGVGVFLAIAYLDARLGERRVR